MSFSESGVFSFPTTQIAHGTQDSRRTSWDAVCERVLRTPDELGEKNWASGIELSSQALQNNSFQGHDEIPMGAHVNGNYYQTCYGGYGVGPYPPPPPRPVLVDIEESSSTSRGTLNDMDWNRVAQAGQRGEASPVMQSYSMIAQELRYHPGQAVNVSSFLPPYSHFYIPGYYVPGLPNAAFVSPSLAPSLLHPFPTLAAPLGAGQPSAIATTVVSAATPPAPTTTIAAPQANPVPAVNLQEYSQHHQIPYRRFPVDAIIRVYDKNMAIWRLCTLMRCRVPGCDYVGPGESLSDHFKSHYKVANTQDGFTCAWLGCSQKVKKMGELKRHLETKHLTIFNWHCSTCHATVRVDDKRGVHPAPGQCAYRGGALDREAVANGSKKTCRECRESPPKSTKELTVKVAFIRNKAQVVGERGVHSKNCSSYFHPEGACGA